MSEAVGASLLLALMGAGVAAFPMVEGRRATFLRLVGLVFMLPLLVRIWLTAVAG